MIACKSLALCRMRLGGPLEVRVLSPCVAHGKTEGQQGGSHLFRGLPGPSDRELLSSVLVVLIFTIVYHSVLESGLRGLL